MKHTHAGPGKGVTRKSPRSYERKMERQREAHKLASRLEKNALKRDWRWKVRCMRLDTRISVSLTWKQVQQICNILAERGRAELIEPFEEAVKYAAILEESPDAYTRM